MHEIPKKVTPRIKSDLERFDEKDFSSVHVLIKRAENTEDKLM
jgi:hypothetical protein